MRFLRLFWFHFKLYATNQYFLWLTISSTVSLFLLQFVAAYVTHNLNDPALWLRSGVFGLWSSATTAAGCIGFQRFQGTLPYIINTGIDNRISLVALLLPASSFGLLAFPISYIMAIVLGVAHSNISINLIMIILALWIAAALMDLLIAAFFLLTTNAIVYEELVTIPLLLVSGLFSSAPILRPILTPFQWLIPISVPIHTLLNQTDNFNLGAFFVSCILWAVITWIVTNRILHTASKTGNARLM
ncbi:multidrug ABC transporter permease [Companilactobacillus hulinensis]|uniref:multidrug ABC transporter permease n=1 Tax=Companilactobacillus hulinensis TaxID=2486007 RepID=UPI000F774520|nr:multidrug ABC transporter permease [Companilactobacillus hulinensis]